MGSPYISYTPIGVSLRGPQSSLGIPCFVTASYVHSILDVLVHFDLLCWPCWAVFDLGPYGPILSHFRLGAIWAFWAISGNFDLLGPFPAILGLFYDLVGRV